jgi:hypothetical protein
MSPFEPCLFDADAPRPALISGIAYMYGWHTSSDPVWSRDAHASLRVAARSFPQPVMLALKIRTYDPDRPGTKTLHLRSTGHDSVAVEVSTSGVQLVLVRTPVMAHDAAFGTIDIALEPAPGATQSPIQQGASQDDRMLGFHIVSVLQDVQPLALPLDLRVPQIGTVVLGDGWDVVEEGTGVWSISDAPVLALPGDLSQVTALAFDVHTLPRPADQPPLEVTLWQEGREIAQWSFKDCPHGIRYCTVMPSSTTTVTRITLQLSDLMSPMMLGINADPRPLGVLIRSIEAVN